MGGKVHVRPGDGTDGTAVRLLGRRDTQTTGGLQVFGDGKIELDAGSDIFVRSGVGNSQGGFVRLAAGAGGSTPAGQVKLTDADTDETRIAVDATGRITINSRSANTQAGAPVSLVSGSATSQAGGAISLTPGSGQSNVGRVALTDMAGADRAVVSGSGSIAINADTASALRLRHGDATVVDMRSAAVIVAAEQGGESNSNVHLRTGSSGDIALSPGHGSNGDGKIVFQAANGEAVMESTGEGSFHVYNDVIFDGDTLSVTAENRVGVGTMTPSVEHAFDVSDHMNVADRLSVADILHVDASRHSVGVGVGSSTPSAVLDVVASSAPSGIVDAIAFGNAAAAAQMRDTASGLKFTQVHASGARSTTARLVVAAERDWTADASSADSYLVVQTAESGVVSERFRLASSGSARLQGDVAVGGMCRWPMADVRCLEEGGRRLSSRSFFVQSSDQAMVALHSGISTTAEMSFGDHSGTEFSLNNDGGFRVQSLQSQTTMTNAGEVQFNSAAAAVTQSGENRFVMQQTGSLAISGAVAARTYLRGGSDTALSALGGSLSLIAATDFDGHGGTAVNIVANEADVATTAAHEARVVGNRRLAVVGNQILTSSVHQHVGLNAGTDLSMYSTENTQVAPATSFGVSSSTSAVDLRAADALAVLSAESIDGLAQATLVESVQQRVAVKSELSSLDLFGVDSVQLTSLGAAQLAAASEIMVFSDASSLSAQHDVAASSATGSRMLAQGVIGFHTAGPFAMLGSSSVSIAAPEGDVSIASASSVSMDSGGAVTVLSPSVGSGATRGHLLVAANSHLQGQVAGASVSAQSGFAATCAAGSVLIEACEVSSFGSSVAMRATQNINLVASSASIGVVSSGQVRMTTAGTIAGHAAGRAGVTTELGLVSISGATVQLSGYSAVRMQSLYDDVVLGASEHQNCTVWPP